MSNGIPFSISKRVYKIPPIPTKYKNRTHRCRLDAKWAVFFDGCLIEARYEDEGYRVNRGYLPDFWLPEYQMFIEVKPDPPTEEEISLARELRDKTGKWVALFHGFPGANEGTLFAWDSSDSGGGAGQYPIGICSSAGMQRSILWFYSYGQDVFKSEWEWGCLHNQRDAFIGPQLADCIHHAADCRFEYGADPTPPWVKGFEEIKAKFHPNAGPKWLK